MTTSYRIVQLVKQRISNDYLKASDADVAKLLDVSRTSVSNYKGGRDVMGQDTLQRAQKVLNLSEIQLAQLSIELQLDQAKTPGMRSMLTVIRDVLAAASKAKTPASILLAALLAFGHPGVLRAAGISGFSGTAPAESDFATNVYYVKSWIRRLRRRARQSLGRLGDILSPPRLAT